jgi:hypothetical protein
MTKSFEFNKIYKNRKTLFDFLNRNSLSLTFWYDNIDDGIDVMAGPNMTKKDGSLGIGNIICKLQKSKSNKNIIYVSVNGTEKEEKNKYDLLTNTIILADKTNPGIITSDGILRWDFQRTYFILPKREYSWDENINWGLKNLYIGYFAMAALPILLPLFYFTSKTPVNRKINFNTARYLHLNHIDHLDSHFLNSSWPYYIHVISKDLINLIDQCKEKFDETKCKKIRNKLSDLEQNMIFDFTTTGIKEGEIVPWVHNYKYIKESPDIDIITSIDLDIYNKWFKYYPEPSIDYQHRDPNFNKKGYQGLHTLFHIIKHTDEQYINTELGLEYYKLYNNIPFFVQQAIMTNPNAFNYAHEDLQKDIGMMCFTLKHGYKLQDLNSYDVTKTIIDQINDDFVLKNENIDLFKLFYFWAVSNSKTVVNNWQVIHDKAKNDKNIIIMAILSGLINDIVSTNFITEKTVSYKTFNWSKDQDKQKILEIIKQALYEFEIDEIYHDNPEILAYCRTSIDYHRDPIKYSYYKRVIDNPEIFKPQNY